MLQTIIKYGLWALAAGFLAGCGIYLLNLITGRDVEDYPELDHEPDEDNTTTARALPDTTAYRFATRSRNYDDRVDELAQALTQQQPALGAVDDHGIPVGAHEGWSPVADMQQATAGDDTQITPLSDLPTRLSKPEIRIPRSDALAADVHEALEVPFDTALARFRERVDAIVDFGLDNEPGRRERFNRRMALTDTNADTQAIDVPALRARIAAGDAAQKAGAKA